MMFRGKCILVLYYLLLSVTPNDMLQLYTSNQKQVQYTVDRMKKIIICLGKADICTILFIEELADYMLDVLFTVGHYW